MNPTTIDLKISSAYKQSEALYKKEPTWQEKIDSLLDRMNELNSFLDAYRALILRLTFEIERDMTGFKKSKLAPAVIQKIVALSTKMLNRIYKSDLYPGIKTTYHTLKQEISYLNELVHDRKVSIELEDDDDLKDIIKSTLAAANRK